jgi:crossover junction endodeoxyribonuclease RusA
MPDATRNTTTQPRATEGRERPLRVTLDYPPSANRYWRNVEGRTLVSREARAYKETAAWVAYAAGLRPLAGPVAITLRFYRPRRAGDVDNLLKVTLDSLIGVAFADDSQIEEIHAYRYDDPERPRVEVEVSEVAP